MDGSFLRNSFLVIYDNLVKSHFVSRDGLWKKFDIRGVVSETAIR